jgi:hypothetical protein
LDLSLDLKGGTGIGQLDLGLDLKGGTGIGKIGPKLRLPPQKKSIKKWIRSVTLTLYLSTMGILTGLSAS